MPNPSTKYLSVILPAYQEARRIEKTLRNLDAYFSNMPYPYEIIVVNDGSTDNTAQIVEQMQSQIYHLRLINYPKNMGKGFAVKCGMAASEGNLRLFMDADNSVKINEVESFIPEIEKGNDVVIGSIALHKKTVSEHNGNYRRWLGSLSKSLIRFLATPNVYDTQRGFKLFTKEAAESIFPKLSINRFGFDIELLVIAQANNFSIKELPVAFDNPQGSTVTLSSYFTTFVELMKIQFKKLLGAYSHDPAVAVRGRRTTYSYDAKTIQTH